MTIPSFAFVGQPNVGKSTVLATLAEDDQAAIGPDPGLTTKLKPYSVKLNQREFIKLWDTPGFQKPAEVVAWFRKKKEAGGNLPRLFLDTFVNTGKYPHECEIMKPLADGAVALYVIDTAVAVSEEDKYQLEILRLCSVPRIAVFNSKEDDNAHATAWQTLIQGEINVRHDFNGHRANFKDRTGLLQTVSTINPGWKKSVDEAIRALEADWEQRLKDTADSLLKGLRDMIAARGKCIISDRTDRLQVEKKASEELRNKIRVIEMSCRNDIRHIYRHTDQRWKPEDRTLDLDLFSEEVWELMGFSQMQLTMAGIVAGALLGLAVDVPLGGSSLGLAALVGAAVGGAGAWWGGQHAVHVEFPGVPVPVIGRIWKGKMGGEQASARIKALSKTPSIFADRFFEYFWCASRWCHGHRNDDLAHIGFPEAAKTLCYTKHWSEEDVKSLTNYLYAVEHKPASQEDKEMDLRSRLVKKIEALTLLE